MKVSFKYGIGYFSGTIDQAVYAPTAKKLGSYMRKHVIPRYTANNQEMGTVLKNIRSIWADVTSGYKAELKLYAAQHFVQLTPENDVWARPLSNFSWFIRLLWLLKEENSGVIDLKSLTLNDIKTLWPEITSVAVACENGFLPMVTGCEDWETEM